MCLILQHSVTPKPNAGKSYGSLRFSIEPLRQRVVCTIILPLSYIRFTNVQFHSSRATRYCVQISLTSFQVNPIDSTLKMLEVAELALMYNSNQLICIAMNSQWILNLAWSNLQHNKQIIRHVIFRTRPEANVQFLCVWNMNRVQKREQFKWCGENETLFEIAFVRSILFWALVVLLYFHFCWENQFFFETLTPRVLQGTFLHEDNC